jgi:hypothetical protein
VVDDFALVMLNWLTIGALLVPLRVLFPHMRMFEYAAGAPGLLLGIALLHAALITLMGYTQGLHADAVGRDLWGQTRILTESVLCATTLMCCVYGLQGAPWATCVLFCGAGMLHFGSIPVLPEDVFEAFTAQASPEREPQPIGGKR